MPRLRQQSAISAVTHFLSSLRHMLLNLSPRNILRSDQLQKLLILVRSPYPLFAFIASSQQLLLGKLEVLKRAGREVLVGEMKLCVGWEWFKVRSGGEGEVVDGRKGNIGDKQVIVVGHGF